MFRMPDIAGKLLFGSVLILAALLPSESVCARSKEVMLYSFKGGNDGALPQAGLIVDASGNLYGTTTYGGRHGSGTVFMLSQSGGGWSLTTLWNFSGTGDGANPACDLLMDSTGAIYGTTQKGGANNLGTVFRLTNSGGSWTDNVLYSFAGGRDGQDPSAGLVMGRSGVLYGTTYSGGAFNAGTVFELLPSGGGMQERVLHTFGHRHDGWSPGYTPLVLTSSGSLYGTTLYGGLYDYGTAFAVTRSGGKWGRTLIYEFYTHADGDGWIPDGGVVRDKSGVLYGTTLGGGVNINGTVYRLTKSGQSWTEQPIASFPSFKGDGDYPHGGVVVDRKAGILYGVTSSGGSANAGTVYQVVLP